MRTCLLSVCVSMLLLTRTEGALQDEVAAEVLKQTGVTGGLVVHLGSGDGGLTAAIGADRRFQVHALDRPADNVAKARQLLRAKKIYGRASVDRLAGDRLPYVDNLVNLLVSDDFSASGISREEVLRVLVPAGVAYLREDRGWTKVVKPVPDETDEWTHYLHDASGNAVAHDTVVGPPRHLQWVGSPRWSRHHDRMASMSALVSSGGRMFYIMDEGSRVSIYLPPRWKLIARDAHNGVVLWKRSIEKWQTHLWPLKSGPTQLARRLVAVGDTIYVTLGLEAPLVALDAATGKTKQTYQATKATEELIYSDGTLFAVVNERPHELRDFQPNFKVTGDQRRVRGILWNEQPRKIVAVNSKDGKLLWSKATTVAPLSLTADAKRVVFHDGKKVVCLDRSQGQELWSSPPVERRPRVTFNFGPRLVLHDGVVLFAGGTRKMSAYDVATGKSLWTSEHATSGYQSPEDILVTGGLAWVAPTTSSRDTGVFTGRDLRTGEIKSQFAPNVDTYWFHHRCYIAKATDRFLLPSRTGIEFVDFKKENWDIHHWVRGGCLYGILPCNGLVYAPPHNCACYPEAKLYGFSALAPRSPSRDLPPKTTKDRLEKGPAFGEEIAHGEPNLEDWPTYRRDVARSGRTPAAVEGGLDPQWSTQLGGRLSALTVADGKVYAAKIDEHTLVALDAESGETCWDFTTGGRIDSPPTLYKGRVLFGSADGHVYCLRASDGELIWRFQAAPIDRRLMAYEQLEAVWPVHGSVLVQDDVARFVVGRSMFLDGGLRFVRLDVESGELIGEKLLDDRDPETKENLQTNVKVLNMPVGLPDVLSSDGNWVYMRSQQFDFEGNRYGLGPHSGDPVAQAQVQKGPTAHLFSPTGYLDGSWFHRSYWIFGRSFAGGHSGYSKAGKFAPAGRLLVFDDDNVYGYGRKPQYFRWTTALEHQLFAASKQPEIVSDDNPRRPRQATEAAPAKNAPAKKPPAAKKPAPKTQPGNKKGTKKKGRQQQPGNLHPKFLWTGDLPLFARAMVLADKTLFVAGPPDLVDEEGTINLLREAKIQAQLARQEGALAGDEGGVLRAVAAGSGETRFEMKLDFVPVWDGMSAARGRLYMATIDGRVICLGRGK